MKQSSIMNTWAFIEHFYNATTVTPHKFTPEFSSLQQYFVLMLGISGR